MIILQASGDITENPAYKIGYEIGYFVGENSTLIFVFTGLILAIILFLVIRSRKKRLSKSS